MHALEAPFPALGADMVTTLDAVRAQGLFDAGLRFVCRYLGSITPEELDTILKTGLLFSPVTYADQFDGAATVSELKVLNVPLGVTVWLDVEGVGSMGAVDIVTKTNAWADAVIVAGYQPGLYVGANGVLTAAELYSLHVVRYWRSMSMVPEPACGFCMTQFNPTVILAGTSVDIDAVGHDYRGRLPAMVGP